MSQENDKHTKEARCESCGNMFRAEAVVSIVVGRSREWWPIECPACEKERQQEAEAGHQEYLVQARPQERQQWRERSGIPEGLITRTFDNFEPGWQDKALKVCRKYAEGFKIAEPKGYRSLILYSPNPGVGKTHLMVAIANLVIDRWDGEPRQIYKPIGFDSGPGLVRRVRATYNLDNRDTKHERETDVYDELRGVSLLMLDDVGKEKPSDFTRELYWYVINERVTSNLPIVMTCRLPLEGSNSLVELMGVDTVDRLYGMTHGHIEILEGTSYRKQNKVA